MLLYFDDFNSVHSKASFWLPFLPYLPLCFLCPFCFLTPLSLLKAQVGVGILINRGKFQISSPNTYKLS